MKFKSDFKVYLRNTASFRRFAVLAKAMHSISLQHFATALTPFSHSIYIVQTPSHKQPAGPGPALTQLGVDAASACARDGAATGTPGLRVGAPGGSREQAVVSARSRPHGWNAGTNVRESAPSSTERRILAPYPSRAHLCAPTGGAQARMSGKAPHPARTRHGGDALSPGGYQLVSCHAQGARQSAEQSAR